MELLSRSRRTNLVSSSERKQQKGRKNRKWATRGAENGQPGEHRVTDAQEEGWRGGEWSGAENLDKYLLRRVCLRKFQQQMGGEST